MGFRLFSCIRLLFYKMRYWSYFHIRYVRNGNRKYICLSFFCDWYIQVNAMESRKDVRFQIFSCVVYQSSGADIDVVSNRQCHLANTVFLCLPSFPLFAIDIYHTRSRSARPVSAIVRETCKWLYPYPTASIAMRGCSFSDMPASYSSMILSPAKNSVAYSFVGGLV